VNGSELPTVFPKWTFHPGRSYRETKDQVVSEFQREFVLWLLTEHQGNVSKAARSAGMDRKQLRHLVKNHRLDGRGK
jgi:DNA-binding NtrC family response regulator